MGLISHLPMAFRIPLFLHQVSVTPSIFPQSQPATASRLGALHFATLSSDAVLDVDLVRHIPSHT